ncbi:sodium:solute symporter family protein [candidate division KSB1 bacterium]|nr:sodium:solute symporter family protein [candidate division KSB1 bacterium]
MFGLAIVDVITICVYFLFVIIIGYWASRRIQSQEDYFLGGRRFGKFVQTFAAFGQATSAESAVGISVIVYRNGLAGVWQTLTGVFGLPMYWITSVWYRRMRLLTLGDFFEERFQSKGLAALYAWISAVFFMIVIGLGFTSMTRTITAIAAKPLEELTAAERAEYGRANELAGLENSDARLLSSEELRQLELLRLENPRKEFSYINEDILIWVVALIVILYAVFGGLEAAFITDTLQGIFILILSLMLLPFAYGKINDIYGTSGLSGIVETAKARLPEANFEIWGSPLMVDFTWYYILAITVMTLINTAIQANQLTACGSAKDEYTARFGFTTGIYLKRWATLLWGVSALLLVVLYMDVVKNPDYLWGYACRDLLGQLGIGLVGLMIACLMAALMSTADALMLTTASLLTRNFFRPIFPGKSEKSYIWAGRAIGFLIIIGAVLIASQFDNVFQMLKMIWEFNIIMAAAFWVGLKWRRATRAGAWASMTSALLFFVVLQVLVPMIPGVKRHPYLLKTIEPMTLVRTYTARDVDVQKRQQEISDWDQLNDRGLTQEPRPLPLVAGLSFQSTFKTPKKSIFWTKGLKIDNQNRVYGSGMLSLELVILDRIGFALAKNTYAMNETIRIMIRTWMPFLVIILVSLGTTPDDKRQLDRFFVKMKTPVQSDRQKDEEEMKKSYAYPNRFDHKKLFPNTQLEFTRLDRMDWRGIIAFLFGGMLILMVLYLVSYLGRY